MEKKKNVPVLRFPEFIGEWENRILDEITDKISDGYHGTPNYDDNGEYYFINGNNLINDKVVVNENTRKVDQEQFEIHKKPLNGNTILLSINGTIGSLAFYNNEKIILGKSACYINLKDNNDKYFIYSQLKTNKINKFFISELTGTTIKNLSLGAIKNTNISLPTLLEQQKISSFIKAIDDKLQGFTKKKNLLVEYKKGMMQKIFSQELRFKDDNGTRFPKWEKKKLGEVTIINPKSEKIPYKFIYIDLESVVNGVLLKEEQIQLKDAPSRAQRVLKKGDVLFQMVRPYQKNNLFFNKEGEYVASTGYAQIRTNSYPQFIFQYFHYQNFVEKVIEMCTGTSYPAINSTDLSNIIIDFPVLSEQIKIANFLFAIDDKINICDKQIQNTTQFKFSLLQKMFC